ncbi:MAG: rane protein required for colicin production [Synergistaceae bacterium]|jgi:membrane protein required for colicin V production|nr:rane protein required for colicin production [Synergistaceae bacterium]
MTFSSVFDIAIALIVASFAVRGLFRGLSGEIFSLLGTVGGVIVAWKYSGVPAAWILSMFPEANLSMVSVGFMVAIYIGVVVLAASICRIVKAFLKFASLTFADRFFGAAAGIFKGAVLILFLYVGITTYSPFLPTEWMESSYVMRGADAAWPGIQDFLRKYDFFPENFSLPDLNLPGLFPEKVEGGNGG